MVGDSIEYNRRSPSGVNMGNGEGTSVGGSYEEPHWCCGAGEECNDAVVSEVPGAKCKEVGKEIPRG